ncbi:MAG TPA: enolase C-terminal domain-like protein [Xanthobacteraceae bacterium]|jgi:L-alanine-DL-glutamate epimerase-like enolase superfamily enzyme
MPQESSIRRVTAQSFRIPTDAPEADGTISWDATTLVLVEIDAGGTTGLGYSYADAAAGELVNTLLARVLRGEEAFAIPKLWSAMVRAVRNIGWRGVCACAISAIDVALWDLKSRLMNVSLSRLLGAERHVVPIYGSGGFTSYSADRLREQLGAWVERDGCAWVKMKVGSSPRDDLSRVKTARDAIGTAGLYVDANGAYSRKQALRFAEELAPLGVSWFEEPVSSDDLEGLRLLRDRSPGGMDIAAGEYGYEPFYFRRMLEAGAVDVLQADATRCGGYTGFLKAAALADAWGIPFSSHTAPALHLPVCCAAPRVRNMEWFYDHVRIERLVFDGAPLPCNGTIRPDPTRPGHGLTFKRRDAERLAA